MRSLITSRSFKVNAIVASITAVIVLVWAMVEWSSFTALGSDLAGTARASQAAVATQWNVAQATVQNAKTETDSSQLVVAVAQELGEQLVDGTAVMTPELAAGAIADDAGFPSAESKSPTPEPSTIVKTCTKAGGLYVTRGTAPATYGVCIFNDGTECNAQHFAVQKCHIGQYTRAEAGMK